MALVKQGQLYFYQLDQLGTPLSLTDSDNNIVWQANYSVFGKATVTVNKIDNPIRFQGQYYDSESGLHYNHFRYYAPQTGRFISQDPIGLLGSINHYQYAPNHINWIDPLGLCAKEDGSVGLLDGIVGTADLVVTGILNTGVDIVAGGAGLVTLAISGGDVGAAAHTIESVQEKQIGPLTDAGEKVAAVVAPVVDKYYEQNMAALGDATLEATASPLLAMAAHKSVELVGTVLGAGAVGKSLKNGAKVVPDSADNFARAVLNKASQAELEVTSFLSDLSQAVGGRLEGLDFALKSEASLSRKISTVSEKYNLSLAEAAADINDALRYTMILDSKSFGKNVVVV
ncbi:RHS domain-containing protein [Rheinheimera baltica]|uniref:RHS repeat-associated core domain-containing protein n=1 Tax=Rheinheimera baltica TaxID=67576 RepID=UPI00273D2901|nr:RHS repeat-associated core domain-containing protein [Rheinheimera baltica]MDP5143335.1 RHS domain-containing protein [Rheinheimera baltica]